MANFVDDNDDSCFEDDDGVEEWEDDNGNILICLAPTGSVRFILRKVSAA
jgi:hypothetical protein